MKLISLRLPEKLEEKLGKYAQKLERSKSYLIRKAVEYYLENLSEVSEDVLKLSVSPVAKNKNEIKCIFLAPAVGLVDFRNSNYPEDNSYRTFSSQVKTFHITINNTDNTLKKYAGNLADKFNPTNLGYDKAIYLELKKQYPIMKFTDFSGMKSHNFIKYVSNEKFKEMLKENDIDVE